MTRTQTYELDVDERLARIEETWRWYFRWERRRARLRWFKPWPVASITGGRACPR